MLILSEQLEVINALYKTYMKDKLDILLDFTIAVTSDQTNGVDYTDVDSSQLCFDLKQVIYTYLELTTVPNAVFTCAAFFENVHGINAMGNVKLKPAIVHKTEKHIQEIIEAEYSRHIVLEFCTGSVSSFNVYYEIEAVTFKINIDANAQWIIWNTEENDSNLDIPVLSAYISHTMETLSKSDDDTKLLPLFLKIFMAGDPATFQQCLNLISVDNHILCIVTNEVLYFQNNSLWLDNFLQPLEYCLPTFHMHHIILPTLHHTDDTYPHIYEDINTFNHFLDEQNVSPVPHSAKADYEVYDWNVFNFNRQGTVPAFVLDVCTYKHSWKQGIKTFYQNNFANDFV